jgi:uncharacterized membrane protein
LISGFAEVVLGIALLIPVSSNYAAWGIIALLIAVFPHIYMYQNDKAGMRLPKSFYFCVCRCQLGLIYWAYMYT